MQVKKKKHAEAQYSTVQCRIEYAAHGHAITAVNTYKEDAEVDREIDIIISVSK